MRYQKEIGSRRGSLTAERKDEMETDERFYITQASCGRAIRDARAEEARAWHPFARLWEKVRR